MENRYTSVFSSLRTRAWNVTAVETFGSELSRFLELASARILSTKTSAGIPILLMLSLINLVPIVACPFVAQSSDSRKTKLTRKGLCRSVPMLSFACFFGALGLWQMSKWREHARPHRLSIGYGFVVALAVYVAVASFAIHKLVRSCKGLCVFETHVSNVSILHALVLWYQKCFLSPSERQSWQSLFQHATVRRHVRTSGRRDDNTKHLLLRVSAYSNIFNQRQHGLRHHQNNMLCTTGQPGGSEVSPPMRSRF